MPYQITQKSDHLRIAFTGHLTAEDLQAAFVELEQIETASGTVPPRLTDTTGVTSVGVDSEHIRLAAESRKARQFANPFRSAIVAPEPGPYGIAQLFRQLNNHPAITIQVFVDELTALTWLRRGPTPAPRRPDAAPVNPPTRIPE